MQEQRLTSRLENYWNTIKKDKALPDIHSFNSSAMEDVWLYCIRLAVQPSASGKGRTYKYEHVGDELKDAYGIDMLGKLASASTLQFPGSKLLAQIDTLLEAPKTVSDQGQFVNEKNRVVKYRACMLPFGREDGQVTHVIAGMSWRSF